jgi:apurinic endonuclease APN1
MGNPYGFNRTRISDQDIEESRKIIKRFPMNVFTHFPYVANLAGSTSTVAWSGDTRQDEKTDYILKSLEYELGIVSRLGCKKSGVVIHPGNFPDRDRGMDAISKSINKINFYPGSKLILENAAGQGTSLATTFQEIRKIIDGVDEKKRDNIGVCIDTCHIYAYGDYNLTQEKEVERMFREFDQCIGLDKLSLVHLNDSETCRCSRKDRHACLGKGNIWKYDMRSLRGVLERCRILGVPIILETEVSDILVLASIF